MTDLENKLNILVEQAINNALASKQITADVTVTLTNIKLEEAWKPGDAPVSSKT